jgi:hypothetical protein
VMIQPYQSAIDTDGETALIFIGGRFDHAIRKGAVLTGPASEADHRFEEDGGMHLTPCDATGAQLKVAEHALDRVPGGRQRLLYARVDLVPGADGRPLLMELELTEPQLFFKYAPGSVDAWPWPRPHRSEEAARHDHQPRARTLMQRLGPACALSRARHGRRPTRAGQTRATRHDQPPKAMNK